METHDIWLQSVWIATCSCERSRTSPSSRACEEDRKSSSSGMLGRDAARKLTLKVNILQVFTIDSSEIQFIVNHNSQSDGQNKSAKRWTNFQKKTSTYHVTPEDKKRYQGQWYLALNKTGKNGHGSIRATQCVCAARTHSIHMPSMMCVWALLVLVLSFFCFSLSFTSSLPHPTCTLPGTPSSMSMPPRVKTTALSHNEENCSMAIYHPLTQSVRTPSLPRWMCPGRGLVPWPRWCFVRSSGRLLITHAIMFLVPLLHFHGTWLYSCVSWRLSRPSLASRSHHWTPGRWCVERLRGLHDSNLYEGDLLLVTICPHWFRMRLSLSSFVLSHSSSCTCLINDWRNARGSEAGGAYCGSAMLESALHCGCECVLSV